MNYTRRQVLKAGAAGTAYLALAGCGPLGNKAESSSSAQVLYEWTYLGTGVHTFWEKVKAASPHTARISQATGIPFDSLYQTVDSQIKAKSGADLYSYFPDYVSFKLKSQKAITPLDDLVSQGEADHWLLSSAKFDGKHWGAPLALAGG